MKGTKGKSSEKVVTILIICVIAVLVLLSGVGASLLIFRGGLMGTSGNDISGSQISKPNGQVISGDSSANLSNNDDTSSGSLSGDTSSGTNSSGTSSGTNSGDSGANINVKDYTPTTVTLTLYGARDYGVTFQTAKYPAQSVVQVSEGSSFNEKKIIEFKSTVTAEKSYNTAGSEYTFYVSKAVLSGLSANKTYTYRCYDKINKVASATYTFKTRGTSSSFKFVHLADSQVAANNAQSPDGSGTGDFVANNTMAGIAKNAFNPEFILHTGDIVEWSKYESYWDSMINANSKYFASLPVMAISGNHETTYRNGTNEISKHFNYSVPEEFKNNTSRGFSYSFDYGNTKFIMLNTNNLTNNKLSTAEYNWLKNTLKNNNKKWTIVSMHNPMYSVGKYGSNSSANAVALALRAQLSDLFAQNGVDLVIQGHDHAYSNTYPIGVGGAIQTNYQSETIDGVKYRKNPNGVIYAMHGPSGNQQRNEDSSFEPKYYEYHSGSRMASWAEIEVTDTLLTVKVFYYGAGQTKLAFSYGIKK